MFCVFNVMSRSFAVAAFFAEERKLNTKEFAGKINKGYYDVVVWYLKPEIKYEIYGGDLHNCP